MSSSKRFLGLELSGAKNQKTTLAVIEAFPAENKVFLLDLHDKIGSEDGRTGDEVLLSILEDQAKRTVLMGINVPSVAPPCLTCVLKSCPLPGRCSVQAVRWMRDFLKKTLPADQRPDFTPYTQRPIEVWIRYGVLPNLDRRLRFDVDETFGGNRAPLTARMLFLLRHLKSLPHIEVLPKLTISILASSLDLDWRTVGSYRHLEQGTLSREKILNRLCERFGIFIYDKDFRALTRNLAAFDAFLCAYTAMLSDQNACAPHPKGFPLASGWVKYPKLPSS